jgi:hypothetical protein
MYKVKNKLKLFFVPENSLKLLSNTCFFIGICCIPISSVFMLYNFPEAVEAKEYSSQILSLFIGLWAVTLIATANFLKKS